MAKKAVARTRSTAEGDELGRDPDAGGRQRAQEDEGGERRDEGGIEHHRAVDDDRAEVAEERDAGERGHEDARAPLGGGREDDEGQARRRQGGDPQRRANARSSDR